MWFVRCLMAGEAAGQRSEKESPGKYAKYSSERRTSARQIYCNNGGRAGVCVCVSSSASVVLCVCWRNYHDYCSDAELHSRANLQTRFAYQNRRWEIESEWATAVEYALFRCEPARKLDSALIFRERKKLISDTMRRASSLCESGRMNIYPRAPEKLFAGCWLLVRLHERACGNPRAPLCLFVLLQQRALIITNNTAGIQTESYFALGN